MPLLILIPLLALLGVFGETFTTLQTANDTFDVQVTYATRYRYKMMNPLEVSVRNLSPASFSVVDVRFAKEYIDQFSEVTFTPQVEQITSDFYLVEIRNLQPGETRVVHVSLQGERYWRHEGHTIIAAEGAEPLAVTVATWIFP